MDEINIDEILNELNDGDIPKIEKPKKKIPKKPTKKRTTSKPLLDKDEADHRNIALQLTDYLFDVVNDKDKCLFSDSTSKTCVSAFIQEFFDTLANIDMYDRNQLIMDLILMVKSGKPEASKILIEMLGFNAASEKYVMNTINYADVSIDEDFFKIPDEQEAIDEYSG